MRQISIGQKIPYWLYVCATKLIRGIQLISWVKTIVSKTDSNNMFVSVQCADGHYVRCDRLT